MMKFIPLGLGICIFIITTIGFFKTKGNSEKVYGLCFAASVVCMVLQLAIIF